MSQLLFLLVVFLSNIIQAVTGFAGSMLAMPAGMALIGIHQARAALNVMGLAASLLIVIKDTQSVDRKEFRKISVLMLAGIGVGLFLITFINISFLLPIYGCFIILIAVNKMLIQKESSLSRPAMILILLGAGILHGMFISGGSLLVIYAAAVCRDRKVFRSTLSAVWVLLNTLLLCSHICSGYFTSETVLLTLLSLLPLFLAVRLGTHLYQRINQKSFQKITCLLLMLSGLLLII